MRRLLVVVDMQNDFVTGALANPDAEKIIPGIAEYIENFDGDVVFTRDTHLDDYMETQEGKKLPVPHCICGAEGWEIVPELRKYEKISGITPFNKPTFGSTELARCAFKEDYDEIYFCGVCTGICVISNVALVKAFCPETSVKVIERLCACVTPTTHKTAIEAMKTFQVDIV